MVLSKFFVSQDENEKLCKGTLLFPENFWYRKKIIDKRGHITISSRNFWSHSAEKVRGHPFNVSENLRYRKIFMHNRGYHVFPSKIFGLTVPKNFVGIHSMFQKIWGIEKFLCIIGKFLCISRFSVENFWSQSAEKFRKGTL